MNTFDVFDTLIARRTIDSDSIFQKIEKQYSIANFCELRKKADNGARSITQIYQQLADWSVIPHDDVFKLSNNEIKEEIDNCYPIFENLKKVDHGDVLISDMYLPNWAILQILRSCGLDKEVTVYQSNGDKRTGIIWQTIKGYHSGTHYGDNHYSDILQAQAQSIKTEYCQQSQKTGIEDILFNHGFSFLSLLCREARLRSSGNIYTELASDVNLVILFIISELLYRKHQNDNIIFLGRDCQLLEKIYTTYYKNSVYLPFSRQVAYNQKDIALNYLNQFPIDNRIFFDISSTGATWEYLGNDLPVVVAIYSDTYHYTDKKPVLTEKFEYLFTNSQIGSTNSVLEIFNCGNHGCISKVDQLGNNFFVQHFDEHELNDEIISYVQGPIRLAADLGEFYKLNIRKELGRASDLVLSGLFEQFVQYLCSHTALVNSIFLDKETKYLNSL